MLLPTPRGPIGRHLAALLTGSSAGAAPPPVATDALIDDDLQSALWSCYELHYRGFDDVPPEAEWDAGVLALRAGLERQFLSALRAQCRPEPSDSDVAGRLKALVDADDGPGLSRYLERRADLQQFAEFVVHRSVYHLKEADPHSWGIPRLTPRPKAALLAIQFDEYGGGVRQRMHSELFRGTMRALGLDDGYGSYIAQVPGVTLAASNLISLFGLHRALRGALLGHLAAFEMTSSLPNRSYSQGLRRLGGDESARRFYDEHVTADALHEQLAVYDLCGGLVADEPELADDVVFGAACCLRLDSLFAEHVLDCWQAGRSSLRVASEPTVRRS